MKVKDLIEILKICDGEKSLAFYSYLEDEIYMIKGIRDSKDTIVLNDYMTTGEAVEKVIGDIQDSL